MNKSQTSKSTRIVSIVACLFVMLCLGVLYMWSIFRTPVVEHYGWTPQAATMVSSFMIFAFVVGNLIGGFVQQKIGARTTALAGSIIFCAGLILTSFLTPGTVGLMYLTYSVIGGLGCGFAYGAVLFTVISWLPHRRGFASGIAAAAFGLSTVVFSPLSNWLMHNESFGDAGVPRTFLTLGIVFLIITIIACLLIRMPTPEYIQSLKIPAAAMPKENLSTKQVLKIPSFWCIVLSGFLLTGLWMILTPLMADLGVEKGLSGGLAVLTVSLSGIFNAGGRLLWAALSDKLGRMRTVQIMGVVTIAASLLIIGVTGSFYMALVLVAAFTYGGSSSIFPAMTADVYGPKFASSNYGVVLLSLGVSSIVFNAISNVFITNTGGYAASFIFAAIAGFFPILLMLGVSSYVKKKKNAAPQPEAELPLSAESAE